MESLGQNADIWTNEWKGLSAESEIRMWDYFGLRPWILKYTPRFGKVLEAGCGLGRNNFYLSHLGIDISGIDFSAETIAYLQKWQKQHNYNLNFAVGDVKKLQYDDNTLSGYLSLGVIEHFKEGPQQVLVEAYRILRPGGIAIITTPNKSWNVRRTRLLGKIKKPVKKIIGREVKIQPFFQYEYTPNQLASFVEASGLTVTEKNGADFLYTFTEYGKYKGNNIHKNSLAYKISPMLDKSFFKNYGAQSITISVKKENIMHCFLCNDLSVEKKTMNEYNVPVCKKCQNLEISNFYLKKNRTGFTVKYSIRPMLLEPEERICNFCGQKYITHPLFEDFGFTKNTCTLCLTDPQINIKLSNQNLKPVWRSRR
ncbi:MAG: class I SAM-dependent methyltransferase [Bacteroidia bacterium]|nr:class I SAM-dependent methyltransferase [Bacteroidia bacterium]